MKKQKELRGRWKVKKNGQMKWVWKRRKIKSSSTETSNARGADSGHTMALTTDGDAHPAG